MRRGTWLFQGTDLLPAIAGGRVKPPAGNLNGNQYLSRKEAKEREERKVLICKFTYLYCDFPCQQYNQSKKSDIREIPLRGIFKQKRPEAFISCAYDTKESRGFFIQETVQKVIFWTVSRYQIIRRVTDEKNV